MDATLQDLMTRRSVCNYTEEMPPKEVIDEIVKAGMTRPLARIVRVRSSSMSPIAKCATQLIIIHN